MRAHHATDRRTKGPPFRHQYLPDMTGTPAILVHIRRSTLASSGKDRVSSETSSLKVGDRLRRARLSKGLRMRDLAQAVGCDESMISKIEAGKVLPSLPMLNKMVRALDRDMVSFFGLRVAT